MSNIVIENLEEKKVDATGFRLDYHLTNEDSQQGFFLEIESDTTIANPVSTALAGSARIDNLTFVAVAALADGEYVVVETIGGASWAVSVNLTGASPEPTGAIWTAIPVANKVHIDVSALVTAIEVAAAFEAAFNGLVGFNVLITTDDTAADGTMLLTHADRGVIAAATTYLADDSASGNITNAEVNAGVDSNVDATAETITIASLNVPTGRPVVITSSGTLPNPLVSGTTYYAINLGAGVYQFASSLANALSGSEVNITDAGGDGDSFSFTPVGGVNGKILFSTKQMTNTELASAIVGNVFFDVNLGVASTEYVGSVGFDFSVQKINKLFIKPSLTVGPVTLPANFRPVFTLLLDNPNMKIVRAQVTRRGII